VDGAVGADAELAVESVDLDASLLSAGLLSLEESAEESELLAA
jgi:hypothetical protein